MAYPLLASGREIAALHVIYGLIDPAAPDVIRYVGKSNSPHNRLLGHVAGSSGGIIVSRWVLGLRAVDRVPDMVLLESVEPGASGRELHWYLRLREIGQADLNGIRPHDRHDFPVRRAVAPAPPRRRRTKWSRIPKWPADVSSGSGQR